MLICAAQESEKYAWVIRESAASNTSDLPWLNAYPGAPYTLQWLCQTGMAKKRQRFRLPIGSISSRTDGASKKRRRCRRMFSCHREDNSPVDVELSRRAAHARGQSFRPDDLASGTVNRRQRASPADAAGLTVFESSLGRPLINQDRDHPDTTHRTAKV